MPYKLLLADDSVTIQRVIELTFADEDVQVTAVGDGQEAVDRILADRPDIVLADVGMPKRDGYEVASFIKNDPALAHIPVLLLTGAFEPVDEARAQAVHCDGVLAKPFEPQLLIGRVRDLLGAARAPRPAAAEPAAPTEANVPSFVLPASGAGEGEPAAPAPVAGPMLDAAAPGAKDDLHLDVESLEFRQESAASADTSLDDYFDRLDAAFAHLTGAQPGREATTAPRTPAGEPAGAAALPAYDRSGLAPAAPQPGDTRVPAAAGHREALPPAVSLPVSEAFGALLDAERSRGPEAVERGEARPAAVVAVPGTAITDALVDDLARRVTERVGESALRDAVAQVVSATAERLIREEIERLKATIR